MVPLLRAMQRFVASYPRKPRVDNPAAVAENWLRVLLQYPISIVRIVLDPAGRFRTLRPKSHFFPDIAEVAKALHLSPKTVETHRSHIKEKLRLENARQVARYAVQWVSARGI